MSIRKNYILSLGLVFLFLSCQDIIKIDIPSGTPTLSVDAVLTNRGSRDTVRLSTSSNYFSNTAFIPFSGAKVILTDSLGASESLVEVSPGIFPIKHTAAKLNHIYYLDIYAGNDHFQAKTLVKRLSPTLDSIKFQYEAKSVRYDTAGFYPYLFGQDLPGLGDYAWIRIYRNNHLLNQPRDLFPISDQLTDGKYYNGASIRTREAFQINDIAKVEIWSISKDVYQYLDQIQTQTNNTGIFQTTPSNVPTNILNMNPNSSHQATGYFIGSLVENIQQKVGY